MKKPMPLPVTLTDYILLDQMGYEVEFANSRPVRVIPKGNRHQIVCSAGEAIIEIQAAFRNLARKIGRNSSKRSEAR